MEFENGKSTVPVNNGLVELDQGNNRILGRNESRVPTVLIGDIGDGKTGIKVSQDGSDVLNCPDDELVMSSLFNSFKIVQSGTKTLVIPAIGTSVQAIVNHNLGYVPTIIMFLNISGYGFTLQMPYMYTSSFTGHMEDLANFEADNSKIYINWKKFSTSAGMDTGVVATFKYYVIRETAA